MAILRCLGNLAIFLVLANCLGIVLLLKLTSFPMLAERIREYEIVRANIMEREAHNQLGGSMSLSANESVVNEIIMLEKKRELDMGAQNFTHFQVDEHFFSSYEKISNTTLFRHLQAMPKGAVLHAHDMALCSSEYLLTLTYREHLWICIKVNKSKEFVMMRFSLRQPASEKSCEWMLLSALREVESSVVVDKKLLAQLTLYPHERFTNEAAVWQSFRSIFHLVRGLLTYAPVWEEYMFQALAEFYADGVQYLEIRSVLPVLYDLHAGNYTILNTTRAMCEADLRFRASHADWIGSRLIYAPTRKVDDARFLQYLSNALLLKSHFPDYLAGFDLVGYEAEGRPLHDYTSELIAVQDELNFYFHAGETNSYGSSTDENLIDAVLLGSKRIGHGLALLKHPEVMRLARMQNIALEISPISNQVLQYVGDLRTHPAAALFAVNYPVVIASDDPSFWKSSPLTHDFYMTFMAIASQKADLAMLRQLAWNSIAYGAFDRCEREEAFSKWNAKWEKWISDVAKSL